MDHGFVTANLDAENVTRVSIGDVGAEFLTKEAVVAVSGFWHQAFLCHEHDALQVAHRLGVDMPDWFKPA